MSETSESTRYDLPRDGDFGALHRGALQDHVVVSALRELADLSASQPRWGKLAVDGLTYRILARLLALNAGGRLDLHHPSAGRRPDWRVRRAMEYINDNLSRDVGLAEVAAAVDLSSTQLNSLFNRDLNVSPHRWLMLRRIDHSCQLLQDGKASITDIALTCGFASSQHFATVFRRQKGMTPSAFRARMIG